MKTLPQELVFKENKSMDDWVALMVNLDSLILGSTIPKEIRDYILDVTCVLSVAVIDQQMENEIKCDEIIRCLRKDALQHEYIQVAPLFKIENTLKEILLGINSKEVKPPHETKHKANSGRKISRA